MNIGLKIKQLRENAGISQYQLANDSGLTYGYISKLEAGKYQSPSLDVCHKLAMGLGLTLRDFLQALNFLETEETKDVSLTIKQALRSNGFTVNEAEQVANYADLIQKAKMHTNAV